MFTGPPAFVLIHVTTLTASALSDHGVSDLWVPCRITQRCASVSRLMETSGVASDFMIALLARPPAADILKQLENARGSKKANCDSRGLSPFDAAYRWSAGPPLRVLGRDSPIQIEKLPANLGSTIRVIPCYMISWLFNFF